MVEFRTHAIMFKHNLTWLELESWLYEHIGHGGRWLIKNGDDDRIIEPEEGDEWGIYQKGPNPTLAIVDDKQATYFALMWS